MKHWVKAIIIAGMLLAPVGAFAGIEGTHHDVTFMTGSATGFQEVCAYCHAIQNTGGTLGSYGNVGEFCVKMCHSATSDLKTGGYDEVEPANPGVFIGDRDTGITYSQVQTGANYDAAALASGHGMDGLQWPNDDLDAYATVANTGWPNTATDTLQCTSCHAVHDSTNPPFLNANYDQFCFKCHDSAGTAVTGSVAGRFGPGTHPVSYWDGSTTYAYPTANAGGDLRTFYVGAEVPTNMNKEISGFNPTSNASSWELGGHLSGGNIGCQSCHAIHHTDAVVTGAALILGNSIQSFCYGCHGGGPVTTGKPQYPAASGNTQENPGESAYYHPVNKEPSNDFVTLGFNAGYNGLLGTRAPAANTDPPYCVSCHAVHGGNNDPNTDADTSDATMALRIINAADEDFCFTCHDSATDHHVTGTIGALGYVIGAGAGQFPATPWGQGEDLTAELDCGDCHTGNNGSAHNW